MVLSIEFLLARATCEGIVSRILQGVCEGEVR